MFAVGILAHSVLLPFVSIIIEMLIVSSFLNVPANLPSQAATYSHTEFSFGQYSNGHSSEVNAFQWDSYHAEVVEPIRFTAFIPLVAIRKSSGRSIGKAIEAAIGANGLRAPPKVVVIQIYKGWNLCRPA